MLAQLLLYCSYMNARERRTIRIRVAIGTIVGLIGCSQQASNLKGAGQTPPPRQSTVWRRATAWRRRNGLMTTAAGRKTGSSSRRFRPWRPDLRHGGVSARGGNGDQLALWQHQSGQLFAVDAPGIQPRCQRVALQPANGVMAEHDVLGAGPHRRPRCPSTSWTVSLGVDAAQVEDDIPLLLVEGTPARSRRGRHVGHAAEAARRAARGAGPQPIDVGARQSDSATAR